MVALSEFRSYLKALCQRYEQWWSVDALTETIAAQQATFSFEQMVETEEKHSEKSLQRVILPIFKGIQDYIESEHILLVGSPGVGKSTTLLRCLVQFAEREQVKPEPRIPVLIELKRYNSDSFSCPEDPSGILTLIKDTLEPDLWLEVSEIKKLLFQDRRLILLLDGLNEMSAGEKRTELEAFRKKCDRCKVPLICTTRKLDGGDLGIKRSLEIQSLNPTEIDRFLQECTPEQRQKIYQRLNRDNRELSRTPFVLWMLYHSSHEQGTEVETLGEAFRQFFRSFKKYKEDAPVSEERRKDWNHWLEHLAFTMLNTPDPTVPGLVISKEKAEKVLAEKFGDLYNTASRIEELLKYHLLESISDKEISFHHQLIQEYYAAECLLTQLPELVRKQSDQKYIPFQAKYLNYVKWTEAISLMLSLVNNSDYVIQIIDLALRVDLFLGAKLAGKVRLQFQTQTVKLVFNQEITETLKIELLGETCSDLVEVALLNILADPTSNVRECAALALGKIKSDLAIPRLIEAIEELDGRLRQTACKALGEIGSDAAISELINIATKNPEFDAVWKATHVLLEMHFDTAIPKLLSSFISLNQEARRNVASVLTHLIPEQASEKLLNLLHPLRENSDPQLQEIINHIVEKINEKLSQSKFLKNSEANTLNSRKALDKWFAKMRSHETVSELVSNLKHSDWMVRTGSARTLGEIGWDTAVPSLIESLQDLEPCVREAAAEALGKFRSDISVPNLLEALDNTDYGDTDYWVRNAVINALVKIGSEAVISGLLDTLRHSDYDISLRLSALLGRLALK